MSEYYAVQRSDNYLMHYGIKGMRWGVRRALESGSDRALRRVYKKATRKMKKLERLGLNGKKYAARAALYGTGAAAATGIALTGTKGASTALKWTGEKISKHLGNNAKINKIAGMAAPAADRITDWGAKTTLGPTLAKAANTGIQTVSDNAIGAKVIRKTNSLLKSAGKKGVGEQASKLRNLSNDKYARVGAGILGAGLGIAAAKNAYRAASAKRHYNQSIAWRKEMDSLFEGTPYENGMPRRRRRARD